MTTTLKPLCPTCLEIMCECAAGAGRRLDGQLRDFVLMNDIQLKRVIRQLAIEAANGMRDNQAYSAAWRAARAKGITDIGV